MSAFSVVITGVVLLTTPSGGPVILQVPDGSGAFVSENVDANGANRIVPAHFCYIKVPKDELAANPARSPDFSYTDETKTEYVLFVLKPKDNLTFKNDATNSITYRSTDDAPSGRYSLAKVPDVHASFRSKAQVGAPYAIINMGSKGDYSATNYNKQATWTLVNGDGKLSKVVLPQSVTVELALAHDIVSFQANGADLFVISRGGSTALSPIEVGNATLSDVMHLCADSSKLLPGCENPDADMHPEILKGIFKSGTYDRPLPYWKVVGPHHPGGANCPPLLLN
ncbi:MAG TPA: hypothetical protein VN920_00325 [Pyrinomonadaceae bacterium]|nr:hypothetical protein [Pyrinomonadaceae bacterium]